MFFFPSRNTYGKVGGILLRGVSALFASRLSNVVNVEVVGLLDGCLHSRGACASG